MEGKQFCLWNMDIYLLTVKAPVSTTLHNKHIARKKRITDESLKPPKCDTPNTTAIIRNAIFVSVLILLKRWLAKLLYSLLSPLSDPYFTSENYNKKKKMWNLSIWVLFTFLLETRFIYEHDKYSFSFPSSSSHLKMRKVENIEKKFSSFLMEWEMAEEEDWLN